MSRPSFERSQRMAAPDVVVEMVVDPGSPFIDPAYDLIEKHFDEPDRKADLIRGLAYSQTPNNRPAVERLFIARRRDEVGAVLWATHGRERPYVYVLYLAASSWARRQGAIEPIFQLWDKAIDTDVQNVRAVLFDTPVGNRGLPRTFRHYAAVPGWTFRHVGMEYTSAKVHLTGEEDRVALWYAARGACPTTLPRAEMLEILSFIYFDVYASQESDGDRDAYLAYVKQLYDSVLPTVPDLVPLG